MIHMVTDRERRIDTSVGGAAAQRRNSVMISSFRFGFVRLDLAEQFVVAQVSLAPVDRIAERQESVAGTERDRSDIRSSGGGRR